MKDHFDALKDGEEGNYEQLKENLLNVLNEHNLVPRTATPFGHSNAIKSATANSNAKSGTEPPQTRASMTVSNTGAQSPLVRPLPSTSRTVEGGMSTLDAVSAWNQAAANAPPSKSQSKVTTPTI